MRAIALVVLLVSLTGCGAFDDYPHELAAGDCVQLKSGGEHGVVDWCNRYGPECYVVWPGGGRRHAHVCERLLRRVECAP